MGRAGAVVTFGLAIYTVFNPDAAVPYGRAVGVVTLLLFGACVWLIGRAALYIFSGE